MLGTLGRWLKPMPDRSLVSLQVRKALLGALRSSGIGKYVKLLTLHTKELPENKRLALQVVEKWSRPIFGTSDKYHAADLPLVAAPRVNTAEQDAQARAAMGTAQTRIPRAMGMDFNVLPQSHATALPSTKFAKESVKGRLQNRIINSKKGSGSTQAVTLSVEGRTLDKI